METERIALRQRERDRLKVLQEVQQKHLTQQPNGYALHQACHERIPRNWEPRTMNLKLPPYRIE